MSTPVSAPKPDGRPVRVADGNAVCLAIDVPALVAALNEELGHQDPSAVVRAYHFALLWAPPGQGRPALFQAVIGNNQPGVAADQHAVLTDAPMKEFAPRYATCRGRCWQTS
jgi:hypothetical protein